MLFKRKKPLNIKIKRKRFDVRPRRPLFAGFALFKKRRPRPLEVKKPTPTEVKKPTEIKKPIELPKIEPKAQEKLLKRPTYMKRNVNFSLFFLIVIILSSLVGLTSYYQNSYIKQASDLKQKTEEFNTALGELSIKKVQLNETSYRLELESKSKEQLSDLYTTIKQEKEAVEADLQKTRDLLLAEKTKTAQLEIERANLRTELEDLQERLNIAEEKIVKLEKDVSNLRNERNSYENKFNACCGGDTSSCG